MIFFMDNARRIKVRRTIPLPCREERYKLMPHKTYAPLRELIEQAVDRTVNNINILCFTVVILCFNK